jgi:hypothetical protein
MGLPGLDLRRAICGASAATTAILLAPTAAEIASVRLSFKRRCHLADLPMSTGADLAMIPDKRLTSERKRAPERGAFVCERLGCVMGGMCQCANPTIDVEPLSLA